MQYNLPPPYHFISRIQAEDMFLVVWKASEWISVRDKMDMAHFIFFSTARNS